MKKNNHNPMRLLFASVLIVLLIPAVAAEPELKVKITPKLSSVTLNNFGKTTLIQRNQNPDNRINKALTLTSRECPPHCIQPINFKGVETIGELELLDYLQKISRDKQRILIIDTRTEAMAAQGSIPGSINIHGDKLIASRGANSIEIEEILTQQFGVQGESNSWDFKQAKTLVLYCYGIWCGQATRTIDALLSLGYPKAKLKWYRGGIQAWESVGLTTLPTQ